MSLATYRSRRGIALPGRAVSATDGKLIMKRKKRGTTTSAASARQFTNDHPVVRAGGDVDLVMSHVMMFSAEWNDSKQQ